MVAVAAPSDVRRRARCVLGNLEPAGVRRGNGRGGEVCPSQRKRVQSRRAAGLHFQGPPHAQGKLVRVVRGRVLDVAVDLRSGSPTFGQHHAALLSGENRWQFYVPPGFAHGFLALEDDTVFQYLCTALYHRDSEQALKWDDPDLGIDWGVDGSEIEPKRCRSSIICGLPFAICCSESFSFGFIYPGSHVETVPGMR